MHDGRETRRQAHELQKELNTEGLSRRAFLDRLKVLGVGFGAAYVLGVKAADAAARSDEMVSLKSTNPALNSIIKEGRHDLGDPAVGEEGDGPRLQTAQYYGRYGRYGRVYGRYARGYARYARGYARYARGYGRYY